MIQKTENFGAFGNKKNPCFVCGGSNGYNVYEDVKTKKQFRICFDCQQRAIQDIITQRLIEKEVAKEYDE